MKPIEAPCTYCQSAPGEPCHPRYRETKNVSAHQQRRRLAASQWTAPPAMAPRELIAALRSIAEYPEHIQEASDALVATILGPPAQVIGYDARLNSVKISCPFCAGTHRHGYSGALIEWRYSHCARRWKYPARSYWYPGRPDLKTLGEHRL